MPMKSKKSFCVCLICTKFKMREKPLYYRKNTAVLNKIYRRKTSLQSCLQRRKNASKRKGFLLYKEVSL